MASYYYLMSSLPMLRVGNEPPIKYEQFLEYCKDSVSEKKLEFLKKLSVESTDGPLIKEWSKFYKEYKQELTYQRYKKLGKTIPQSLTSDYEVAKAVSLAIADENPLSAENTLLTIQFEKLDSIISTHNFDDYSLFGYALKLKLLERKTIFDQKKGKAELNRLVKGLENQVDGIN